LVPQITALSILLPGANAPLDLLPTPLVATPLHVVHAGEIISLVELLCGVEKNIIKRRTIALDIWIMMSEKVTFSCGRSELTQDRGK
jgi:hypothetical protein